MTDDVVIFKGNRKKAIVMLFASAAFAALGLPLISEGKALGWAMSGFFGLGIPVSIFMIRPNATYLKLDKSGVEMKTMFAPMRLKWTDVESFYISEMYMTKMIGITYSKSYKKMNILRKLTSSLTGVEGALPDNFKSSPEEICQLLNIWKMRYGNA